MNTELKQLIEDAAKLLGYTDSYILHEIIFNKFDHLIFDPFAPERGDLMKVVEAAELMIDFEECDVTIPSFLRSKVEPFTKGDYQSLALAVLRAASAVYKSRGGE